MKARKPAAVVAVLMTVAVFILTLSPTAAALLEKNGSITLNVTDNATGVPLSDASFRLYNFAKAYESAKGVRFELIPPYDKCNVDINDLQDASLPVHLAYFAASEALPYTQKSTDANGVVEFENLTPGLYLVVPSYNVEGYYISSPFIISIPEYDSQSKSWNYDIDAGPKINGGVEDGDKDTYISVVKKWETDGTHPESITVVLLRDFREYAKVELNEENNWHYRWDNLPKNYVWNVVETQVPDGYTVYYDTSSNTVTIINKSDETGESATEPSTGTEDGTTTRPTGQDDEDDGDEDDDLIHTGQLNWPVPVLAITGLLLFSIGWAVLNLGKKESE